MKTYDINTPNNFYNECRYIYIVIGIIFTVGMQVFSVIQERRNMLYSTFKFLYTVYFVVEHIILDIAYSVL